MSRYSDLQTYTMAAYEDALEQADHKRENARREPKTRMKIMREQYLNLMRKHGYVMYQSRNTYEWFLTKNAGASHRMKLLPQIAEAWIREGIVYQNAGAWALKEGRDIFMDDERDWATKEARKLRKKMREG